MVESRMGLDMLASLPLVEWHNGGGEAVDSHGCGGDLRMLGLGASGSLLGLGFKEIFVD